LVARVKPVRNWLLILSGLGLLGGLSSVTLAYSISSFIGNGTYSVSLGLGMAFLASLVIKVAIAYFQDVLANRIASKVKAQFRSELLSVSFKNINARSAEVSLLATRGLDSLDAYFGKFLPQLVTTVLITPIFVILFFVVDPISGVILAVTIPLIPLFMIFIGLATKTEQDRQLTSMSEMGNHFSEVIRGLGTLKLFGRIEHQRSVITELAEKLRQRTMKVLRISFLSGFALELTASLSVALLAVSIGFRLLDGEMNFALAMFILILAPECYLPIRMIGSNYHASSEGIAAASRIMDLLESKSNPFEERFSFKTGLEIWTGRSGSGKSRKMESLVFSENSALISWMPQQPMLLGGTIKSNIVGSSEFVQSDYEFAKRFAALEEVSDDQTIDDLGAGISGGQAQRVALARAIYRLRNGNLSILLLDEPTSSLDYATAAQIWENLVSLANDRTSVIVITHQLEFSELAERVTYVS